MCGIIGYLGDDSFVEYVLQGLQQIQNRGYDSVGIAHVVNNELKICKQASLEVSDSLKNVSDIIRNSDITSGTAIGHTRWATHGGKTDINAHPHCDISMNIAVVHNGIIVNHELLKDQLKKEGITFVSQTDTEVIPMLINKYKLEGHTTKNAIQMTIDMLEDTWALAIICKDEPNKMWITRKGSPLLLGINDSFAMVASEQSAFSNYITQYIPINDHDIIEIELKNNKITYSQNVQKEKIINKSYQEIIRTPDPYPHWMLKEIFDQPSCVLNAVNHGGRIDGIDRVKLGGLESHKSRLMDIEHLIILGCGTSLNAGQWSLNLFKTLQIFKSINVFDAAEFEDMDIPGGNVGIIMLSQSGETRDLIRCLDLIKNRSIATIGIINVVDSLLARETMCGVYLNAGTEHAVASTKSFTNQCIILALIATWFSQQKGTHSDIRERIIYDIRSLTLQINNVLNNEHLIDDILKDYDIESSCFILGKGSNMAIANECALKLKEIGYIHAEGFSSSALKHGPFALIVEKLPIFIINTNRKYYEKNINAFNEVLARGANVHMITNKSLQTDNNLVIDNNETFDGLLANIYLQLLSYKVALYRGINPDFPRNLAKVVTVD